MLYHRLCPMLFVLRLVMLLVVYSMIRYMQRIVKWIKNVNNFCACVIKNVHFLTHALLLCVCSVMIKRVRIVYTVFRAVCRGNELIR